MYINLRWRGPFHYSCMQHTFTMKMTKKLITDGHVFTGHSVARRHRCVYTGWIAYRRWWRPTAVWLATETYEPSSRCFPRRRRRSRAELETCTLVQSHFALKLPSFYCLRLKRFQWPYIRLKIFKRDPRIYLKFYCLENGLDPPITPTLTCHAVLPTICRKRDKKRKLAILQIS